MKPSILLIEDDGWLADSYISVLNSRGHHVEHLATAEEAMDRINTNPPALVIADLLLGDHTSFLLFHELQSYRDTAGIPVIVCTNIDTKQLASVDLKDYGIVEVLDKATLTPEKLLLSAESHLPDEERGV